MIRTETDPDKCRELWEQFSPNEDAWDDWDLMYAFHYQDKHHFQFLVHESGNGPDGLVPLVNDTLLGRHTLMAGSYPDGRILWIRYEDFPEVFEHLPEKTVFFDLKHSWVSGLLEQHPQYEPHCSEQDVRYFLVPAEFEYDFYKHIDTFSKDNRQKFLYDLRYIRKREPVLHWSEDDESELFIELVNKNFGAESDYATEDGANELRRVIDELKESGRLKTLVIEIEGKKEAVSLSLLQGKKMVALYAASNNDYNNLGKLLNVETIQEACRLQLDEISYMTGMQWKANWKMKSEPVNTLRKPVAPWEPVTA